MGDDIATYMDDNGYVFMGLFQFLKNEDVMEWKININTYILEQLPVEYKELTKEVDEKNQTTFLRYNPYSLQYYSFWKRFFALQLQYYSFQKRIFCVTNNK